MEKDELIITQSNFFDLFALLKGFYKGMPFKISNVGPRAGPLGTIKKESKYEFIVSTQPGIYLKICGWHKIKFLKPLGSPHFYLWAKSKEIIYWISQSVSFQELLQHISDYGIATINIGFRKITIQTIALLDENIPFEMIIENREFAIIKQVFDNIIKLSNVHLTQ